MGSYENSHNPVCPLPPPNHPIDHFKKFNFDKYFNHYLIFFKNYLILNHQNPHFKYHITIIYGFCQIDMYITIVVYLFSLLFLPPLLYLSKIPLLYLLPLLHLFKIPPLCLLPVLKYFELNCYLKNLLLVQIIQVIEDLDQQFNNYFIIHINHNFHYFNHQAIIKFLRNFHKINLILQRCNLIVLDINDGSNFFIVFKLFKFVY